jgi:hypothetical protein
MMGGVNTAVNYFSLMGFAKAGEDARGRPDINVTNSLLQGGIVR